MHLLFHRLHKGEGAKPCTLLIADGGGKTWEDNEKENPQL